LAIALIVNIHEWFALAKDREVHTYPPTQTTEGDRDHLCSQKLERFVWLVASSPAAAPPPPLLPQP
jgi:hypothetical protein